MSSKVAVRTILLVSACLTFNLLFAQDKPAVIRLDQSLDAIVDSKAKVEKVAGDLLFAEGPAWVRDGGYLIFSDIPNNVINKLDPATGKVTPLIKPSGFTGADPTGLGKEQTNGRQTFYNYGSNGVAIDPDGKIVFIAMGDRQIIRMEKDGTRTILAANYIGNRLNSGNDLVFKSNGPLYFTDPPSGLRGGDKDPKKEINFNGVYVLRLRRLQPIVRDLQNPNGIALSPDEKFLYVDDTTTRKVWRYELAHEDEVINPTVFVDMSGDPAEGNPDGMKVDQNGNLFCTGPGGIWIISPSGKHLGTLVFPERPSNLAFGDADGKTIYVTARSGIYKMRVKIAGIRH